MNFIPAMAADTLATGVLSHKGAARASDPTDSTGEGLSLPHTRAASSKAPAWAEGLLVAVL